MLIINKVNSDTQHCQSPLKNLLNLGNAEPRDPYGVYSNFFSYFQITHNIRLESMKKKKYVYLSLVNSIFSFSKCGNTCSSFKSLMLIPLLTTTSIRYLMCYGKEEYNKYYEREIFTRCYFLFCTCSGVFLNSAIRTKSLFTGYKFRDYDEKLLMFLSLK